MNQRPCGQLAAGVLAVAGSLFLVPALHRVVDQVREADRDGNEAELRLVGAGQRIERQIDRGTAEGPDQSLEQVAGTARVDLRRVGRELQALLDRGKIRARDGDVVPVRTPAGAEELEVVAIVYRPLATGGPAASAPG